MNFANFRESFIMWIIQRLSNGLRPQILEEIKRVEKMQDSFLSIRKDFIYLLQEGFNFIEQDSNDLMFEKVEYINHGAFPGKYKINIVLKNDYPFSAPLIYFKPMNINNYSKHLMDKGFVCVMKNNGEDFNDYWKPNMNVKGALMLSYQVVTGQLEDVHDGKREDGLKTVKVKQDKKESVRNKIPINNTIFEELSKYCNKKVFVKHFKNKNNKLGKIDDSYSWEELAYVFSTLSKVQKKDLIVFYNKNKKVSRR